MTATDEFLRGRRVKQGNIEQGKSIDDIGEKIGACEDLETGIEEPEDFTNHEKSKLPAKNITKILGAKPIKALRMNRKQARLPPDVQTRAYPAPHMTYKHYLRRDNRQGKTARIERRRSGSKTYGNYGREMTAKRRQYTGNHGGHRGSTAGRNRRGMFFAFLRALHDIIIRDMFWGVSVFAENAN